jgi:hypothetical protein
MEATAEPSASNEPLTLMQVLAMVLASVEGFWLEKMIRSRRAAAVAARLARASERIEALLARFQAGEVLWRAPRAKPQAEDAPEPTVAAAAEAVPVCEEDAPPRRKRPYRLPSQYGWLAETLPVTAVFYCQDLIAAMQLADMQALMRATPEVARIMRPIFRMLALEDDVLKVPDGYVPGPPTASPGPSPAQDAGLEPGLPGETGEAGEAGPHPAEPEKTAMARA